MMAADKMTIRDVSRRWSTELKVDWRDLERRLLTVSLDGLFDTLPSGSGLLVLDHDFGKNYSTTGAKLRTELEQSGQFIKNLIDMREMETLAIHKDAVLLFATEDAMLKATVDFMQNGALAKEMHAGEAKGAVLFAFPLTTDVAKAFGLATETTGLMIAMRPDSKEMLAKFKDGTYTGFSIGGSRLMDEEVV